MKHYNTSLWDTPNANPPKKSVLRCTKGLLTTIMRPYFLQGGVGNLQETFKCPMIYYPLIGIRWNQRVMKLEFQKPGQQIWEEVTGESESNNKNPSVGCLGHVTVINPYQVIQTWRLLADSLHIRTLPLTQSGFHCSAKMSREPGTGIKSVATFSRKRCLSSFSFGDIWMIHQKQTGILHPRISPPKFHIAPEKLPSQ